MEKVFLNNELVDIDKACVSAADSGLLYGAGLFETMRSSSGIVFRLDDHLERLCASAIKLSIHTFEKDLLAESVHKVLNENKLADARLRLMVTNGSMSATDEDLKPTLLITATKFQPYPDEYYKNGVLAVICPFKQTGEDPLCGHKTTSYFPRMMGLNFAHQKHGAEALWFTTGNKLAEGCVSNVFLVKDSTLYTPMLTTPVLPGIARRSVCEIAGQEDIKLVEKDLFINDVLEADEIFLTNVIMQVMPVSRIEKYIVGDGKVGWLTSKLIKSFRNFFSQHCRRDK